ncbi:MAG: hypothetical protein ACREOQ_22225 [Gemmatimonadales bacterium]
MGIFISRLPAQKLGKKQELYEPSDVLMWCGPLVQVEVKIPVELEQELAAKAAYYPAPVYGVALIDTGATFCHIDYTVVKKLALKPTGIERTQRPATGRKMVKPAYVTRFSFPRTTLFDFQSPNVCPYNLSHGGWTLPHGLHGKVVAVLGREFLKAYRLTWDGPAGSFSIVDAGGIAS